MSGAPVEARAAARAQLVALASADERIVCIDSDVGGLEPFATAFPDRYVDVGIAEANMMSVAAGMAHLGAIPFVNSFAAFAMGRAFEQVKVDICYPGLAVKILATHAGLSAEHLGPTHHSIADLALARSLPNMTVLVPADAADAERAVVLAARLPGPVFIRLGRKATRAIVRPAGVPDRGVDVGAELLLGRILRPGHAVTLICTGPLPTLIALDAADALAAVGVESRIVNLACLKPIDAGIIRQAAIETGGIVTVEDHSVIGGTYSAVCEVVAQTAPCRIIPVAINDHFVEHVEGEEAMLAGAGISAASVFDAAMSIAVGSLQATSHHRRRMPV